VTSVGRKLVWIATSCAAGLIASVLLQCGSDSLARPDAALRGLASLAIPPGLVLAPVIRLFGGSPIGWSVLTVVGVLLSSILTIVGFGATAVFFAVADSLGVTPGLSEVVKLWMASIASAWFGGAALGFAQLPALPVGTRWLRWILATMCGSAAVGPLAFAALLGACESYGLPVVLLGLGGGLIYGISTALALPAASTAASEPQPPLRPSPRAPR
jgi:hypothetical protein